MLAAEGYIYAGNFAAAQALIDASRAKHGLPSIGTITSATQQIRGRHQRMRAAGSAGSDVRHGARAGRSSRP